MKKVKVFLMVMLSIISISIVSCKSCSKDSLKIKRNGYDFETVTKMDYNHMLSMFDSNQVQLLYSQAFINGYFDEMEADSIRVNAMEVLFQVNTDSSSYVYLIRHADPEFNPDNFEMDSIPGHWSDCAPLNLDSVCVTFVKAIHSFYEMNVPKEHTYVVVLRKPTNPKYGELYLIGSPEVGVVTVLSAKDGSFVEDVNVVDDFTKIEPDYD